MLFSREVKRTRQVLFSKKKKVEIIWDCYLVLYYMYIRVLQGKLISVHHTFAQGKF